jgi:hypothetical protein
MRTARPSASARQPHGHAEVLLDNALAPAATLLGEGRLSTSPLLT